MDENAEASSLIVQYRNGAGTASSLAAYVTGANVGETWDIAPGMREVQLNAGIDIDSALAAYSADPNVLFAEPDYRVKLNLVPNDVSFLEQWPLRNTGQTGGVEGADIKAPDAWDLTLGDPSIIVAVIDTGVDYTHPDLAPNMWTNTAGEAPEIPDNDIDDDGNGYVDDYYGYDFANNDGDPMDDHFHGTHVAGTIAAVADNGIGIAGVAPGVRIMALKFLDESGGGETSDAIAALNYAVANGATISNNSWGGGGSSQAFQAALNNANSQSHIFVAAAGNDANNDDSTPFYPASYTQANVVSVAATNASDGLAWFSNYGKKSVDLGAPGVGIFSTLPTQETAAMLDHSLAPNYGTLNGTSMAAPHVAGVIALVRSMNPGWGVQAVIQQVLTTVDPAPALTTKTVTGGRVNAAAALGIVPVDTTPPRVITSDPTGLASAPIDRIRIEFSEPIDPSSFDVSDVFSFTGPDGPLFVNSVDPASENGRQFDIQFDPQSTAGNYSLLLTPHIADFAGLEIDQNRDGNPGVDGDDNYEASFSISGSSGFPSSDLPINLSGFDAFTSLLTIDQDLPIGDVNVSLNITYPRVGNLAVWLVSPAGTSIYLSYRNGGNFANFENTTFDDEATTPISDGAAPFEGSFQPDDALAAFKEQNALGTWQLFVQNVSTTPRLGTLNAWALEITEAEGSGGGGDPPNDPPTPVDDAVTGLQNTPRVIQPAELLINDTDPNGDPLTVVWVGNAVGGSVVLDDQDGTILVTPDLGGLAPVNFQYLASDGISTALANVTVILQPLTQYHNFNNGKDVNNDGVVSPIDALHVINQINAYGPMSLNPIRPLAPQLYFDVIPDNFIAANDVLSVINYINAQVQSFNSDAGGGEGEAAESSTAAIDEIFASPWLL